MNLQSDDFELLGLVQRFALDESELAARWKALQAQVHPDRFASGSAAEKRMAMQWSVRINEAYQRLRKPLSRATYLCELHGSPIGAEDNTSMPRQFLMQQMEWLEALDDAQNEQDVAPLEQEVEAARQTTVREVARLLDESGDWAQAAEQIRAWMFLDRFQQRVHARRQQLADH
ncbi:Fe-S protein assembly co-chaperone HscB [Corticibacter populi]|uniref:Co-chaperone protein HscB homolog n=1 Tax=Corticibacter populi TaxID=1550736 RepID=A0A3M6QZR3_9BURK|nr:Fe-S protein assembly co-chaperone HscB [Corticibacter populi]RMX08445.1 Fe-S protein assembly co-chaperone HscB [Corticibacter populi]RZS35754.1 molecular chaperone HscB [Corticibacter populi]